MRKILPLVFSYLVPTFALGFVWHLVLFKVYYEELEIYREDMIIPFGFLAMTIQAFLFSRVFEGLVVARVTSTLQRTLTYAAFGAVLSWSFTTLTVAAKNIMTSVPNYVLIETAFTVVQWALVAPLTVFVYQQFVAKSGTEPQKALG